MRTFSGGGIKNEVKDGNWISVFLKRRLVLNTLMSEDSIALLCHEAKVVKFSLFHEHLL